jgi:hypothetical protein
MKVNDTIKFYYLTLRNTQARFTQFGCITTPPQAEITCPVT